MPGFYDSFVGGQRNALARQASEQSIAQNALASQQEQQGIDLKQTLAETQWALQAPDPVAAVKSLPHIAAAWQQHGVNIDTLDPEHAKALLQEGQRRAASQLGMGPPQETFGAPQTVGIPGANGAPPTNALAQIGSGGTVRQIQGALPYDPEKFGTPQDLVYNGQPAVAQIGSRGTVRPIPGAKPYNKPESPRTLFSDKNSELLAALAAKGVSLPTGMRSKEQQISTLNGLLNKFPNQSPDEIADLIATGQIDFGAAKKETQTAATVAGRVAIAANELKTFAPLVLETSAKVPRGSFIPITKLLQMGQESISDPNLIDLKIAVNSMLNAYDLLAARGGTDMEKRREAHSLITKAQSPEALAHGVVMFQREAEAAMRAAAEAERYRGPRRPVTGPAPASSASVAGWTIEKVP